MIDMRARRSPLLQVLPPEPPMPTSWKPLAGVPPRDQCRGSSLVAPCPFVHCPAHLWMIDAVDRPGRRHANGAGPSSELRIGSGHTCERDVREYVKARRPERGPRGELMTYEEIGKVHGCSAERARQIAQSAQLKLRALGMTFDEYLAAHESAA